jgi:hypothetical protein
MLREIFFGCFGVDLDDVRRYRWDRANRMMYMDGLQGVSDGKN